jgi:predicted alpha/beta superfamily hydrolase
MRSRGVKTGGADKFLAFLKQELMPFIEKNYRASKEDKTYIGYSYGGLFAVYTLFHSPETFSRYIIGSPGIVWANETNLFTRYEKEYAATHKALPAKVFMSIGSLESKEELEAFKKAEK